MEEDHRYKVIVGSSNLPVATKMVRNSTGSEYRSFTPGVQGSNPCGPTPQPWPFSTKWRREERMNSSTAERPVVNGRVESSNLSSSAMPLSTNVGRVREKKWVRRRWRVVTVCKTVVFGLSKFESCHSHNGRESGWSKKLSWKQLSAEQRIGVPCPSVRRGFPLSPQNVLESWQSGNVLAC